MFAVLIIILKGSLMARTIVYVRCALKLFFRLRACAVVRKKKGGIASRAWQLASAGAARTGRSC